MPDPSLMPITPETVAAMSRQMVGGPWEDDDFAAIAIQLNALEKDMAAFRRVELGESEPAVVYSPVADA